MNNSRLLSTVKPILVKLLVDFVKVLQRLLGVWFDGGRVRGPASRANLSVFLHKLESLDQPQRLVHVSSNWEIIDSDLPQLACSVKC